MATTVVELGQKLKAKHPGEYDDLTDADVGRRLKRRYPGEYDDFIDIPVGMEKLGAPPGGPKVPLPRAPGDPFSMDLNQSAPVSTFGGTAKPRPARSSTVADVTGQAAPPSTARRNPRTGLPMPPGSGPLKMLDWTPEGTQEATQGVAQMGDWDAEGTSQTPKPTAADQLLGGGSKVFRGSMKAAAPALLPYGVITAGPGVMATGLATGGAAGAGTEAGLSALGVSPEKSAAAGDVASVLFGMGGGGLYGGSKALYNKARVPGSFKVDPKLVKILVKSLRPPFLEKGTAGQLVDYLYPDAPEPKPFSPPVPRVTPQGQGIPGFPKPPGAPEPKVYPAPAVTPQGRGLSGFPKQPGPPEPWAAPRVTFKTPIPEKPFSPGLPPPPRFKPQPTEPPFNPGVPPLTYPGWTAKPSGESPGVPQGVTNLLETLRAQQPPAREPIVPREPPAGAAPGNAPHEPIRPEDTNPAATYSGTGVTPGSSKPIDMEYLRGVSESNGETPQKTMLRWLHEAWKDAYGVTKTTHPDLSNHIKGRYGVKSMTELTPEESLNEYHSLKNIAIRKGHTITPPK